VVAVLVRLKLSLLRGSLRQSAWRIVGLVLGLLYGLSLIATAVAGLIAIRLFAPAYGPDVTVLGFALLSLGWTVLPLVAFGVDETLDPGRFALLPLRARELLPGLLVCSLVGTPGVALVLLALAFVVSTSSSIGAAVAAVVAAPIGVATCVLLSRVATSAASRLLRRRRSKDVVTAAFVLLAAGAGLGVNLLTQALLHSTGLAELAQRLAAVAGWTPFGWAWAAPTDVASGALGRAAVRLFLALALAVGLALAWERLLARGLTSPLEGGGSGTTTKAVSRVDRLCGTSPAGAVAARCLRYWRRDPRYATSLVTLVIVPVVITISSEMGSRSEGSSDPRLAFLAPVVFALLVGLTSAQDTAYDGTALWTHVTTGIPGRADRSGRLRALAIVTAPAFVLLEAGAAVISERPDLVAASVAVALALALGGAGVSSWAGAVFQSPVSPAGSNPFRANSGGGLAALIGVGITFTGAFVSAIPAVVLAVVSLATPVLAPVAVVVALLVGTLVVEAGVRAGGRHLDAHWPEVLSNVTEKRA
jgi:ABC-2 type transport system permease protein